MESLFKQKCYLLAEGLQITESLLEAFQETTFSFSMGRKAGAGPAGGRYFRKDGSVVNAPLYGMEREARALKWTKVTPEGECIFTDEGGRIEFEKFHLIPTPNYYAQTTEGGVPLKKYGLIHGIDCFATTIYQRCLHWENGNQCQYCGIQDAITEGATTGEKTPDQLLQALSAAFELETEPITHITLTAGTTPSPDKGLLKYISVVKALKKTYPDVKIHVQVEPIRDKALLETAKAAGVDTIGVHLEILDEEKRKEICPGKAHVSRDEYNSMWSAAVDVFGSNQVSTFVLTGYVLDLDLMLGELEEIIAQGVIPFLVPVRHIGTLPNKPPETPAPYLYNLSYETARLLERYNLNPFENQAGCVRCGGCSPIPEAYLFAVKNKQKKELL